MTKFNRIKTIFFDYDGTLHNSIKIYEPAFKKAYDHLVKLGHAPAKEWKTDEIAYWLGFNSKEMWKTFLPNVAHDVKMNASKIIKEEMQRQTDEGLAELYPGTLDTLQTLKQKGYRLVFISNCGLYYMDMHNANFKLDHYFDRMVCAEQHEYIPKYDILKQLKSQFPEEMVIIGDRIHDIETGTKNNIHTIGCRYGFGSEEELANADLVIDDIRELIEYL